MFTLEVRGGKKSERALIEEAFWWVASELMPRKRILDVDIVLKNITDDAVGLHVSLGDYEHLIEIQKGQDEDDLLATVFHEMVHVRQTERGEFKNEDHISYWKKPSEKEAYKLQKVLLKKWKTYQKTLCMAA
jgi:hypothetical protein